MMKRRELIVEDEKRKLKIRYDSQSRRLHLIPVGSALRIQDHRTRRWDRRGTVIEVGKNRDYQIKFQSGRILWRTSIIRNPTINRFVIRNPKPAALP